MHLQISKNLNELSNDVAGWMVEYINKTLEKQETFSLVLSGGNTPKKLHQDLAGETYKNKIDWHRIHIFWGDERFVPITDERNNAKMAFDTLLNFVPVKKENIHIIQTENISPQASAVEYEKEIRDYFVQSAISNQQSAKKNKLTTYHLPPTTSFDLVLLGMGDDGHTLSLFPNQKEVINEKEKYCASLWLQLQKMYRITLTAPIVNASAAVAFLVSGHSKKKALQEVLYGDYEPLLYPSQIIKPANGELHWFVDEEAFV